MGSWDPWSRKYVFSLIISIRLVTSLKCSWLILFSSPTLGQHNFAQIKFWNMVNINQLYPKQLFNKNGFIFSIHDFCDQLENITFNNKLHLFMKEYFILVTNVIKRQLAKITLKNTLHELIGSWWWKLSSTFVWDWKQY